MKFSFGEETTAVMRRTASRLNKPQSAIAHEAEPWALNPRDFVDIPLQRLEVP